MLLASGVTKAFLSVLATCGILTDHGARADLLNERADATTPSTSNDSSMAVTTGPSAWVSLSSGTPVTTITPQVTTISGQVTTKDGQPMATLTDSSSTYSDAAASSSSSTQTSAPLPSGGSFPVCHDSSGPFAPFCQPTNGSDVWVGETYYVTWEPTYFTANSTIKLELNFADPEPDAGKEAWHSDPTRNSYGFVTVTMDDGWLKGLSRNNLTFYIVQIDPTPDAQASIKQGPTVSLIRPPIVHPSPAPRPVTSQLGLVVGLPVGLLLVAVVVVGFCIGMRRTKLGVKNVVGRRKGYGIGQSRRQRMKGIPRAGAGGFHDDGMDPSTYVTDEGFKDEPTQGMELEERRGGPSTGSPTTGDNAFRAEVERQKGRRI